MDADPSLSPFESIERVDDDDNQEEDEAAIEEDEAETGPVDARSPSPVPLFHRIRTVTFNTETCTFTCNCYQFERIGLPCVHLYSVIKFVEPNWLGFTHHQVSVRWWSVYIAKGYPSGTRCPISQSLSKLAGSGDILAPEMLPFHLMLAGCNHAINPPRVCKVAWERVVNYTREQLKKVFCTEQCETDEGIDESLWFFLVVITLIHCGTCHVLHNPHGTIDCETCHVTHPQRSTNSSHETIDCDTNPISLMRNNRL